MARGLQKIVQRLRGAVSKHGPVIAMMNRLAEDMQNRFHNIEHFRLLSEATLLDPRFKQRAFHDAAAADDAAKSISAAAARVWSSTDEQTQAEHTSPPAPPSSEQQCSQHQQPNIHCSGRNERASCRDLDSKNGRPTGLVESKASSI